ncbi:hypothetical protein P8452_14247 [Trifolium repens]|nr:hypothetical protein P8452_14247 [Trifolium repens]
MVSAFGVCGPALYWRFKKGISLRTNSHSKLSCPPCICHCPPPLSLFQVAPGLANLSVSDCGGNNPELKEEMEKAVCGSSNGGTKVTRREADKCVAATETCEQAREQAEAKLTKERKITLVWEKRARQMGWEGE